MTVNVRDTLDKICNNKIFENDLCFTGGTALAYYLNHRVSEDIDIVSANTLPYKQIIPSITALGGSKIQDENITALRIAGLVPDEYIIKFVINSVKLEFFQANRPIQKEILSQATFETFENSKVKILDLKTIAKLKIVAFVMREKSRDLFDFGAILENKILTQKEIIVLFAKMNSNITTMNNIIDFIKSKKEPQDDEAVYLSEKDRVDLSFKEIQTQVIESLKT
ncbi:MAG: nucleotidyl transferase AbiEii/AbiGii toxin family protein [Campylobacterales bacterium]|nr:nucleotidyl transferase AbiEii/AbiGii toxin family protein [Campylobacterales bacterium]